MHRLNSANVLGNLFHVTLDTKEKFATEYTNPGFPFEFQVRKKEPSHPIRVAKTIDVISRVIFPVTYFTFLIFFFIHYKAFS